MGLLDDVLKNVGGAENVTSPTVDGPQYTLASAMLSMLSNQSGGFSGLIHQFTSQGLGHLVGSWISTGENLPISSEQLQSVLGSDQVKAIAAKAGISPEAAQSGLAQILPQLVDKMTPNGEVPQGDFMSKGMELLRGKFFS